MKRIEIAAQPRENITVSLVGVEYVITPPKGSLGLRLAKKAKEAENEKDNISMWDEIMGWVRAGFGAKQTKKIQERLDDPDDDLDIEHITTLMEKIIEATTDNPTSSSSD